MNNLLDRDGDRDLAEVRQALLDAVDAEGASAVPRRRRRRVLAAGLGAGATAVAVAVVALVVAGGSTASDARAAVIRAAQALPDASSGRMVLDTRATSDADGSVLNAVHEELRFSGPDVDVGGTGTVLQASDGRLVTEPLGGLRVVGGAMYVKDGERPWRRATPPAGADATTQTLAEATAQAQQLPDHVHAAASASAATALASALTGVRRGDDGRTFDGTVAPAALRAAYGAADPMTVELVTANLEHDLTPIAVHIALGPDGALSTLTFTRHTPWTHPTLTSATLTTRLDYSHLGDAQQIAAPAIG